MLFDKKEIDEVKKDMEERKGGSSSRGKDWEGGEHLVEVEEFILGQSKSGKMMLTVHFSKNPEYGLLFAHFMLEGPGSDIHKQRLVEMLFKGFYYELKPCKDEKELMEQLKQLRGKQLKIAVRLQHKLYDIRGGKNKGETVVIKRPEYWYAGHKDEKTFSVKPDRIERPLSDAELKRFNEIAKLSGKAPRTIGEDQQEESTVPTTTGSSGTEVENPDLPF